MIKPKNIINKLKEKWSGLTKSKRIAFIIISVGIITSIITLIIYNNSNKYGVLFSNMNTKDSGAVLAKLKEKKIEYKVEGNTIKVPKNDVDTLRLQMASEVPLTNGSVGFEIFDQGKFGSTDEEMKIKYQRAVEGELERTIKSLPEVDDAKVNLVMADNSVFVRNPNKASASLTIKLKYGKELKKDQVRAIVDLLCSSVKDLDRKNVVIIAATDTGTKLLTTPGLFNDENNNYVDNTQEQQKIKTDIEKRLEDKVQTMLDKVYGSNNVVVKVNANLNFDAIQQNDVHYDPKGTVISQQIIQDTNKNNGDATSNSPVDDNMAAREQVKDDTINSSHKEEKTNYDVGKSQIKTVKAPGAITKLTTSVLLNGNIDENTRTSVNNLVMGAIGYNEKRGDTITVEGMNFDKSVQNQAKKDLEEMTKEKQKLKSRKMMEIVLFLTLILLIVLGIIITKIIKNRKLQKEEDDQIENVQKIDTVIGDIEEKKQEFKPIEFEEENEKTHIEKEIKDYANKKPDQVAEVVKSWLTEDER